MKCSLRHLSSAFFCCAAALGPAAGWESLRAAADAAPGAGCHQFMVPPATVQGRRVGQEDCRMLEAAAEHAGRAVRRIDMGISGTAAGWLTREGARSNHFTSSPDIMFVQVGNPYRQFHGILRYEASKGASLTLVYPESGWNGKLYVTAHGSSGSFRRGTLKAWDAYLDRERPLQGLTRYETLMLEKGYAVAKTRRNADNTAPGDYAARLDEGEIVEGLNSANIPEMLLDYARLAGNLLASRLGSRPSRIYWYGHSGGVMVGRLIQYRPEINVDTDGTPIIDGFLFDDPGGGLWLPVRMREGRDVLFTTDQERARFARSIDIAHQLYNNIFTDATPLTMDVDRAPEWVSRVYLLNKRRAAALFREKGLGDRYRMYEVRGISHSGGEDLEGGRRGDVQILPLWRLMDGLIDLLDAWVEKGAPPPPTRSDSAGLGDADADGVSENPALDLPDTACPLGVYFQYPPSLKNAGAGSTSFAAFDGRGLEPLDGRGVFVDMNLNRVHDERESATAAWRRLGLLGPQDRFSRSRYVACVQRTVDDLRRQGFLTRLAADLYLKEAGERPLPEN